MNQLEKVEYHGIKYAEIIWANVTVKATKFFSPPESSFAFEDAQA